MEVGIRASGPHAIVVRVIMERNMQHADFITSSVLFCLQERMDSAGDDEVWRSEGGERGREEGEGGATEEGHESLDQKEMKKGKSMTEMKKTSTRNKRHIKKN